MSAPSNFIKSLIRIASIKGREVLENIIIGQFELIQSQSGKMLTTASANGKSFSFQVDPKLTISELMAACEEALETFDGHTPAQIAIYLSTRPARKTTVHFGYVS